MEAEKLAYKIANLGLEKKGKQIVVMDLRELAGVTDFFVIMTGDSDPQLKAISDHIIKELREEKIKVYHKEGFQSLRWILID